MIAPGNRLLLASRALAAIEERDFVTPDDVRTMARPVLEHRLILRPESEIEGVRRCEKIKSRRRNGLRHQCKSSVPKVGQAVSPARDGLRTFFSHLLTAGEVIQEILQKVPVPR